MKKKIIMTVGILTLIGFIVGILANMTPENFDSKTVYFPNDPDYDKSVLDKLDWGWDTASDEKKQEIDNLIEKIMTDKRINANSMMYLTDEDILIVTLYPEIHTKYSNDEIQGFLQEHTKLPVYISYDVSFDHDSST